ncbi:MAG TPA: T9SS type A sorting domain-containing protein [Bacteroidales bacterium]|nr:T9SS type A sorting domain-containing protein [Bacteroidales bacterium]
MKKNVLFLIVLLFSAVISYGQTATTIADGLWYMPTTWDCSCIPGPGYTVNINHNVILDNDFALNGGAINIGISGELEENMSGRYLVMYAGSIVNNGTIVISNAAFYGGVFNNNHISVFDVKFFSGAVVNNSGDILGVDSLFIQSDFNNGVNGELEAVRATVNDTLLNYGQMNVSELMNLSAFINNNVATFIDFYSHNYTRNNDQINFTDLTSDGFFENYGTLHGVGNMSNIGHFYNSTSAQIGLDDDFSNTDTANGLAYFVNEGAVLVSGSFFNGDTITGAGGHFCIGDASSNDGAMLGTFDFCDITGSGAPDINTGYISSGITYCQSPCSLSASEPGNTAAFTIYPNPSDDKVFINCDGCRNNFQMTVSDMLGNIVLSQISAGNDKIIITRDGLPAGIYIYQIVSGDQLFKGKIVLQ